MSNQRQSNIELIRIVAMTFIVVGHIFLHICKGTLPGTMWYSAITVTGVNLFVMISGFFNIRLSWQSFLSLLGIVLFYQIVEITAAYFIFDYKIQLKTIVDLLIPMSRRSGVYWFVSCYLMLMLFSPFINLVLSKTTIHQYLLFLSILLYISCFSGWFANNEINFSGYNLFHLITIYVIGDAIRRFDMSKLLKQNWWIIIYIIATIGIPLLTKKIPSKTLRYNNPLVIAASIALFIALADIKFESKFVNFFASYMFPVYLLQEGYLGLNVYNILYNSYLENRGGIVVYFALLFIISLIMDTIRRKSFDTPIRKIAEFMERHLPISNIINEKL